MPASPSLPAYEDLVACFGASDPSVRPISLSAALAAGEDPQAVLSYLAGLGIAVRQIDDLLQINDDLDEEELHAWPCRVGPCRREGVAVSIASDEIWLIFVP